MTKQQKRPYSITFTQPSITEQYHAEYTNVGSILDRYRKTGILDHVKSVIPQYGDFTNVKTYDEALTQIIEAQDAFMQLDPKIRAKFNNDPSELLKFVSDVSNYDLAVDMGIIEKPVKNDLNDKKGDKTIPKQEKAQNENE
jgi:phage internal scaffolding protein